MGFKELHYRSQKKDHKIIRTTWKKTVWGMSCLKSDCNRLITNLKKDHSPVTSRFKLTNCKKWFHEQRHFRVFCLSKCKSSKNKILNDKSCQLDIISVNTAWDEMLTIFLRNWTVNFKISKRKEGRLPKDCKFLQICVECYITITIGMTLVQSPFEPKAFYKLWMDVVGKPHKQSCLMHPWHIWPGIDCSKVLWSDVKQALKKYIIISIRLAHWSNVYVSSQVWFPWESKTFFRLFNVIHD